MFSTHTYSAAIADLRSLLALIGRHDFRSYGYAAQLRSYRATMRAQQGSAA
jgi:hypothetical protein